MVPTDEARITDQIFEVEIWFEEVIGTGLLMGTLDISWPSWKGGPAGQAWLLLICLTVAAALKSALKINLAQLHCPRRPNAPHSINRHDRGFPSRPARRGVSPTKLCWGHRLAFLRRLSMGNTKEGDFYPIMRPTFSGEKKSWTGTVWAITPKKRLRCSGLC